jgi:hypothetical protein
MTIGIKVSPAGKDVKTATNKELILNSELGTIKFLKWGSGSKTVNGSTSVTETIAHNAGFFPICLLYAELTPGSGRWYAKPFNYISSENTYIDGNLDNTYANSSNLVFKVINNTGSSKTVNYYYYVIGETGK